MDHCCNYTATTVDYGMITKNGNPIPRKTTKGWYLLIFWEDSLSTWEPLGDIEESHLIEVAEYAIANKLETQPAFLKKRNHIIAAIKSRCKKKASKFGIEIPNIIERVLEIDPETNTDIWAKAINKEMHHVFPVFKI
jgi:hypothetical protein